MARQFIYHMSGLTKAYNGKKVLENLHLSFYPDAKIGILGPNGSGKSTVLRIMAGMDKEWTGEAWLSEGATCGYLPQEPQLDNSKTALENVLEGVAAKKAILDEYNALMMDYNDENAEKAAKIQDVIDAQNLWDLDSGELRCASCCSPSLTFSSSTSRPTISTPRPSPGLKSICENIPAPC
jgi:ATPase subunit of ABC transporter with duplicated ATPase domains